MTALVSELINVIQIIAPNLKSITPETKIGELFCEDFDGLNFVSCLYAFQIMYDVDIDDELAEDKELSLDEFASEIAVLPKTGDPLWVAKVFRQYEDGIDIAMNEFAPESDKKAFMN